MEHDPKLPSVSESMVSNDVYVNANSSNEHLKPRPLDSDKEEGPDDKHRKKRKKVVLSFNCYFNIFSNREMSVEQR
jgi:hypothetical protein